MLDVEKSWDTKRKSGALGRVNLHYKRACVFIKDHETMLKLVPQGSEYVSLISGTLTSIVFVSIVFSS